MEFLNHILYENKESFYQKEKYHIRDLWPSLIYSYYQKKKINIQDMMTLSTLPYETIIALLDDYIILDPEHFHICHNEEAYVLLEDYLSGNLIEKYNIACLYNDRYGGMFQKNVDLLFSHITSRNMKHVIDCQKVLQHPIQNYLKQNPSHQFLISLFEYHSIEQQLMVFKYHQKEIDHIIQYIKNVPNFQYYLGYTYIQFSQDAIYQMLFHDKSIIIEADIQIRMYTLLMGAALLTDYHIVQKIELIVNQNLKKELQNIKKRLNITNHKIKIITTREIANESPECVFLDSSAKISKRVLKYIQFSKKIVISSSHFQKQYFEKYPLMFYFNDEKWIHYDYIDGLIPTSPHINALSYEIATLENQYDTLQQLSSLLSIQPYSFEISIHYYSSFIQQQDLALCQQHHTTRKHTTPQLIKERLLLSLTGHTDGKTFTDDSKIKDAIEMVYLYYCVEHKKQLIYTDTLNDFDLIKNSLIQLGVNDQDIQIITSSTKIKDVPIYISCSKNVYPFQISSLDIIHHFDVSTSLEIFYSRMGQAKHYLYITVDSIDTYFLQNLFFQQYFQDELTHDYTLSQKLNSIFIKSTTQQTLISREYQRMSLLKYMTSTTFSLLKKEVIDEDSIKSIHFTRNKKRKYNQIIQRNIDKDRFSQKKKKLLTLGNYDVFLPENFIAKNPYLILQSHHQQKYLKLIKGGNYMEQIITTLKKEKQHE